MSIAMTAVTIVFLLAFLLVGTACVLGVWFVGRRLLVSSLVPQRQIDQEAHALIGQHHDRALAIAEHAALEAWQRNDFAAQGRWERIERAIIRFQRAPKEHQAN